MANFIFASCSSFVIEVGPGKTFSYEDLCGSDVRLQPDRSDERKRIEAAGGRVIFLNGARVEGILAMSRAIGNIIYSGCTEIAVTLFCCLHELNQECLHLCGHLETMALYMVDDALFAYEGAYQRNVFHINK